MENTQANLMVLDNSTEVITKEFKDLLVDTLNEVFNTNDIEELKSIVVTDTQTKEYKDLIAKARKLFKEQDDFRKNVKKAVNEKYVAYEDIFKKEFKEPLEEVLNSFDKQLKEIEEETLNKKIKGLELYLQVKTDGTSVEGITLEQVGITKVLKSTSDKNYQKDIDATVDRYLNEIEVINNQPNAKYILVEYKKDYNLARSIDAGNELASKLEDKPEEIEEEALPIEVEAEVSEALMDFVLGFKNVPASKVKRLKEYLAQNNIEYEFMG